MAMEEESSYTFSLTYTPLKKKKKKGERREAWGQPSLYSLMQSKQKERKKALYVFSRILTIKLHS